MCLSDRDVRADATLFEQKRQACLARRSAIEDSLADVARQQERIYARIDLGPNATLVSLDAEIARRTQQRTSLLDTFEHMNRRYGELKQELTQAKHLKAVSYTHLARHRERREARARNGLDAVCGSRHQRPRRPPQPLGKEVP